MSATYPTAPYTVHREPTRWPSHAHEWHAEIGDGLADCGSCGETVTVDTRARCYICGRPIADLPPADAADAVQGADPTDYRANAATIGGSPSEQETDPDQYAAWWHYVCAEAQYLTA